MISEFETNNFKSVPINNLNPLEPNQLQSAFSSGYFSETFDPLCTGLNETVIPQSQGKDVKNSADPNSFTKVPLDHKNSSWESLNQINEDNNVTDSEKVVRPTTSLPPDLVSFVVPFSNHRRTSSNENNEFHSDNEMAPLMDMDLIPRDLVVEKNLNRFPDDPGFMETIQDAQNAIEQGILPELITQGSSGSYFVRNTEREIIGVFKPKSEEPYGNMNPKLMKWLHKMCCPCCFGRGCLIPNQGYLSEAAASVVDKKLQLGIVPNTRVVWLSSESFNYTKIERAKSNVKKNIMAKTPTIGKKFHRLGLPSKVGSFQRFVKGYKQSDHYLRVFASEGISQEGNKAFQLQFERLVVLDYIIRNTDRGNDNWLINYERPNQSSCNSSARSSPRSSMKLTRNANSSSQLASQAECHDNRNGGSSELLVTFGPGGDSSRVQFHPTNDSAARPMNREQSFTRQILDPKSNGQNNGNITSTDVKIAAIDNGLAFPFKHPDSWRMYPYHWVWLPYSKTSFSQETRDQILPLISDMNFVEELCKELETLFRIDSGFDKRMFERQMSVLRGQILNLSHALKEGKSPLQLVQMPLSIVERASSKNHNLPLNSHSRLPAGATEDNRNASGGSNGGTNIGGGGSGGTAVGSAKARIRHFSDQFSQSFHKKKPFFSWW
ncbi:phosphatidylinositol 4-kinase type 2-alpha-like [Convolutriloba macropyga]|uniref:phosphatidylinositol 4-kinase type 2-alpha-like n=1 Tax=Convolutriloba macropyga TaxID=536237 RepID=UPI003F52758B